MRRTSKLLLASLGLLALVTAALPARAVLLVDRGLPIGNLNDTVNNFTAGANRANVAWTDGGFTPSLYVLEGDTFKNTSSQTWSINQITLWTVGSTTTAALWGGIDGSTIGVVSSTYSMKNAFYASPPPDDLYLGNSGAYISMHQIDFAVNILLAPGQTYDFFLDGTGGAYTVPFVHASNAALSGSPQDGADNWMLQATVVGGNISSVAAWTSDSSVPGPLNGGWDKASDVNVRVYGTPVPEPTTMIAGALLLLPFGASSLRILRKRSMA